MDGDRHIEIASEEINAEIVVIEALANRSSVRGIDVAENGSQCGESCSACREVISVIIGKAIVVNAGGIGSDGSKQNAVGVDEQGSSIGVRD